MKNSPSQARTGHRRRGAIRAATIAISVLAAGCAADSSSTDSPDAQPNAEEIAAAYAYAGSDADTDAAVEAGAEQAAADGGATTLPKDKTIALLMLSGQSASSVRMEVAVKEIAELLGWKTIACDPNFDAQKLQQCATSLLAQNPSMIISASQNPSQVASAVAEAKEKGIPWFGVLSGGTQVDGFTDYGINGTDLASEIDAWLIDRLATDPAVKGKDVLAFTAPTVGVANLNQQVQLEKDLEASGGRATLETAHDLDLSNVAQDVLTTTTQTLNRNPNLGAVWTVCDFCVPLISQAVTKVQGASRHTLVVGTFSTPQSVDGIRKGTVDAIGEYPWETQVWVAVDQALEFWARQTPVKTDFSVFEDYNLPLMQPYILEKETVGTSGPAPILGADYTSYFTAKWKAEFGVS